MVLEKDRSVNNKKNPDDASSHVNKNYNIYKDNNVNNKSKKEEPNLPNKEIELEM